MSFNLLKNIKFNSINRALFNRSYSSATGNYTKILFFKTFLLNVDYYNFSRYCR
jgi:hypothetical protein